MSRRLGRVASENVSKKNCATELPLEHYDLVSALQSI